MKTTINGYTLDGDLSMHNAGNSRWGFCSKGGHSYYIKEFLKPVYPEGDSELSERRVQRLRQICKAFEVQRRAYYDALMRCRTGNNVVIQDFFRSGSRYYVVTDRIDAAPLTPAKIAMLDEERKMTLIRALVYSVAALHAAGIVHADLKPDNLLIKKTAKGFVTAKIIDFDAGFLKSNPPQEVPGDFVYLAPEARLRMDDPTTSIDEKIDIFALGILIHQYWTGELPRFSAQYHYTFEAVLNNAKIVFPTSLPINLRMVVDRALTRNPLDRPSAVELLRQLGGTGFDQRAQTTSDTSWHVETRSTSTSPHREGFFVPTDLG